MERKDPAMPEQRTTAGTEDRRPTKAEEVWIAIGPFSPVGKRAVVRAAFFLIVLGTLTVIGVFLIHGDGQERNRLLEEQNQILRVRRP